MSQLIPFALKDTPNLIESGIFPVQKLSYEAQRERKSVHGQILPQLGAYWKGRKPLILVRAVILGLLLPPTGSDEDDLQIFEKLLAFDDRGLARRAFAGNKLKPYRIVEAFGSIDEPHHYFEEISLNTNRVRWKKSLSDQSRIEIICRFMASISSYPEKAIFCKRAEEIEQDWLYSPVWKDLQKHYADLNITANSFNDLVEQFGVLRFGHRARVGDPFAGGGSIPFESARIGCDVYAADLNPIACMLNWGAFNIIGAPKSKQKAIEEELVSVRHSITKEIDNLGFERNEIGEQAKAFLYCTETICPQTQWRIPISGSWVISEKKSIIATMIPNVKNKNFDLKIKFGASGKEIEIAKRGSVQNGKLVYTLEGKVYENSISSLRGDFIDQSGKRRNQLRSWTRFDIEPKADDVFTERLFAVEWIRIENNSELSKTYFSEAGGNDYLREQQIRQLVIENLEHWQYLGILPSTEIERGYNTDQPIRERGWTHWHHFFNPRQLLLQKMIIENSKNSNFPAEMLIFATRAIDYNNRGCRWAPGVSIPVNLFDNQALNTLWNYGSRSSSDLLSKWRKGSLKFKEVTSKNYSIRCQPAKNVEPSDIFISDPPYADAVHYHEITEIFISWLQEKLPPPFDEWTWDSRRTLAIKGSGIEFRTKMIEAYQEMSVNMPDNGYQCVMFTHSSIKVWADITKILWASGLQVVTAWCVSTETSTSIRDGNHIQGTVLLILRKQGKVAHSGYKQIILSKISSEVKQQVETMMNLNEDTQGKFGESTFNNADIQLAGQAAALRILTSYTSIGGEEVSTFALRTGENVSSNVVEEIVSHAIDIANSMLYPALIKKSTWEKLTGEEKFYLQLMDIGTSKLDSFQNYAKLYRVFDYQQLMSRVKANNASLKAISKFNSRELVPSSLIGQTWLGHLISGLQLLSKTNTTPEFVTAQIMNSVSDFILVRNDLINLLEFIEVRSTESEIREAATLMMGQLRNQRL